MGTLSRLSTSTGLAPIPGSSSSSSLPPWLGFIAWALHPMRTQCNNIPTVSTNYPQVNVYVHSVRKLCNVSTNYARRQHVYMVSIDYTYMHIRCVHVYAYTRT